jgi:hypothetical protein
MHSLAYGLEPVHVYHTTQNGTIRVIISYLEVFRMYRQWRPLGLREVEAPTFSDIRFTDGGKVVSRTRRPAFTLRNIPGTYFC